MTFSIFLMFVVLLNVGSCLNKVLFRKETGVYFQYDIIRRVQAASEFECGAFCSNDKSCGSVNYKISGEGSGTCELNKNELEGSPCKSRNKSEEYVYLQLVKPLCKRRPKSPEGGLDSSTSLSGKDEYIERLTTWLNDKANWQLCYRASQHGWNSSVFHSLCDAKASTVTIARVEHHIFGGYSGIPWGGSRGPAGATKTTGSAYHSCTDCFLFSLDKNHGPLKVLDGKQDQAIYSERNFGPTFGGGYDLQINLYGSHSSVLSSSNLGHSYQLPPGYTQGSSEATSLLAGKRNFIPTEVEVFYFNH